MSGCSRTLAAASASPSRTPGCSTRRGAEAERRPSWRSSTGSRRPRPAARHAVDVRPVGDTDASLRGRSSCMSACSTARPDRSTSPTPSSTASVPDRGCRSTGLTSRRSWSRANRCCSIVTSRRGAIAADSRRSSGEARAHLGAPIVAGDEAIGVVSVQHLNRGTVRRSRQAAAGHPRRQRRRRDPERPALAEAHGGRPR